MKLEEAAGVGVEGPADEFRSRLLGQIISEEVARLPDDYRSAVTLYHFNGMTYEEIAGLTRRPMGTVKAQIHRARAILKARLVERVGWESLRQVMWE